MDDPLFLFKVLNFNEKLTQEIRSHKKDVNPYMLYKLQREKDQKTKDYREELTRETIWTRRAIPLVDQVVQELEQQLAVAKKQQSGIHKRSIHDLREFIGEEPDQKRRQLFHSINYEYRMPTTKDEMENDTSWWQSDNREKFFQFMNPKN